MAATRHLGCRDVSRVGSSPTWGTNFFLRINLLLLPYECFMGCSRQ